jgi:hypothetical protein
VGIIGFHLLFPDESSNECRTVIPIGRAGRVNDFETTGFRI